MTVATEKLNVTFQSRQGASQIGGRRPPEHSRRERDQNTGSDQAALLKVLIMPD